MKIGFLAMSGIRAHDPELLRARADAARVRRAQQGDRLAAEPRAAVPGRRHAAPGTSCATSRPRPTARSRPRSTRATSSRSARSAQVFEAYAIADRLRAAGVSVAMGGLHVTRAAGRSGAARRLRHHRRRRERLAGSRLQCRGSGKHAPRRLPRERLPAGRRRARCRCRATTCSARRPLQPLHRADVARLSVAVRLLRVDRHARAAVPQAAGRARHARHPTRSPACVRGRSSSSPTTTRSSTRPGARSCAASSIPLRSSGSPRRHLRRRRPGAARPDARGRLPAGADRPGKSRRSVRCEGIELRANFKARRVRRLRRRDAAHSGARHHGQRLLHPRPRRPHARHLRGGARLRAASVRLYDVQITVLTPFPGTPLYDRLLPGGPTASRRTRGTCARCSTSTTSRAA